MAGGHGGLCALGVVWDPGAQGAGRSSAVHHGQTPPREDETNRTRRACYDFSSLPHRLGHGAGPVACVGDRVRAYIAISAFTLVPLSARPQGECEDRPMRIISLLPSTTEILFDLGVGDQVVGVTF